MINASVVEENMSNLTSASGEISASSGSMYTQQSSFVSTNEAQQPPKKKRSLPGNPDPDAEVIALSPKSLLATNRFVCEICNKGFQRDQNLQLHKRGHNLPWKLKQRANKVERKKVYVCPEPTCVHHDPSRALGDLTGIKKHFSRKHGEKKWKCEKCSKRYAVQSDWKAHSKICGTREYRCECGKIFSRRDSFITHRAFCDVLAGENARAITNPPLISLQSQQPNPAASQMPNLPLQLQSQGLQVISVKREHSQHNVFSPRQDNNRSVQPWLACSPQGIVAGSGPPHIDLSSSLFSGSSLEQSLVLHENPSRNPNSTTLAPFMPHSSTPHMSATALLQKAAQMGVTMSKPSSVRSAMLRPHQAHMSENTGSTATAGSGLGLSSREDLSSGFVPGLSSFGNKAAVTSGYMEPFEAAGSAAAGAGPAVAPSLLHDMMSSLSSASGFDATSSFDEALNGMLLDPKKYNNFQESALLRTSECQLSKNDHENRDINGAAGSNIAGGSDGLTRDFLGLKAFPNRELVNITGFDSINPPPSSMLGLGQQNQNQRSWHG